MQILIDECKTCKWAINVEKYVQLKFKNITTHTDGGSMGLQNNF